MTEARVRITTAIADLNLLLPAVPNAMRKDNSRDGGGTMSGPVVSSMPVNADVLSAAETLNREVRAITSLCRAVLGDGPREWKGIIGAVQAFDRYGQRLDAGGKAETLAKVADSLESWRRLLRAALGLHQPSTPLGSYDCPHHLADPVRLVVLGGEGTLERAAHGWMVAWTYAEAVYCPGCRARWTRPQWPLLGKMLTDQDEATAA